MAPAAAAAEVDPAALAYIRYLVEEFGDTTFEEACFDQTDEYNDGDLFHRRPEPSDVPAPVARALDTVEDLLWRGSPTLAAYARQDIRNRCLAQESMVAAAAATVREIDAQIDAHRDAIVAKRRCLRALRAAVLPEYRARLAALTQSKTAAPAPTAAGKAAEVTGAVMSLLERLNRAQEEEAELAAAVDSLRVSLPGLLEQLEFAVEEAEEEEFKLDAMPQLPGLVEDVRLLFHAQKRFLECLRVLREFLASL